MGIPRDLAQIAKDRKRIGEMYLQGKLQADIGKELGLNQSTISRDLKALHKDWLASALMDFNKAKSHELAKLDLLEVTYWEAWARSCEIIESTITEKVGENLRARIQREPGIGDPRYLQGVQWCIERRCKIIGIDAPVKSDITSGGEKIALPEFVEVRRVDGGGTLASRADEDGDEGGVDATPGAAGGTG